jgi:hypothetical protein
VGAGVGGSVTGGSGTVTPNYRNDLSALPRPLKNRYFAMRHGKSEANAAGLIVSVPKKKVQKKIHKTKMEGEANAAGLIIVSIQPRD